jgi:hypothetical protein
VVPHDVVDDAQDHERDEQPRRQPRPRLCAAREHRQQGRTERRDLPVARAGRVARADEHERREPPRSAQPSRARGPHEHRAGIAKSGRNAADDHGASCATVSVVNGHDKRHGRRCHQTSCRIAPIGGPRSRK